MRPSNKCKKSTIIYTLSSRRQVHRVLVPSALIIVAEISHVLMGQHAWKTVRRPGKDLSATVIQSSQASCVKPLVSYLRFYK